MFALHPQLAADTAPLGDLALCRVLLMNDSRFPWLILVPRIPGAVELHALDRGDRAQAVEDVAHASAALARLFAPHKINLAALGNVVPQLHFHVVARFRNDAAWPSPVWGRGERIPYGDPDLARTCSRLRAEIFAPA